MKLNLEQSGPFIGLAGMATTLFLYGWSAVALPGWLTSLVLPLVWLVLLLLAMRWFTTHPYRVLALPLVATAVWFAVMLSGAAGSS